MAETANSSWYSFQNFAMKNHKHSKLDIKISVKSEKKEFAVQERKLKKTAHLQQKISTSVSEFSKSTQPTWKISTTHQTTSTQTTSSRITSSLTVMAKIFCSKQCSTWAFCFQARLKQRKSTVKKYSV